MSTGDAGEGEWERGNVYNVRRPDVVWCSIFLLCFLFICHIRVYIIKHLRKVVSIGSI